MIITRSPLRISLGGGGTDLPSYYRKHSGFLIAAALDKYVYITLHQTFQPGLIVKWHMDSESGGFTEDASGNGYNGKVDGATAFSPARFQGGYHLESDFSSSAGFAPVGVRYPDDPAFQPDKLTVLLWVRSTQPGDNAVIVTKGSDGSTIDKLFAVSMENSAFWNGIA